MTNATIKRRIASLEQARRSKPEPDPYLEGLSRMISIIYDDTLTDDEKQRLIEALDIPEPTTQEGRNLEATWIRNYGHLAERKEAWIKADGSDASHEGK